MTVATTPVFGVPDYGPLWVFLGALLGLLLMLVIINWMQCRYRQRRRKGHVAGTHHPGSGEV